jgi:hypothetical protein
VLSCDIASLGSSQSFLVTVSATTDAADCGVLNNTAAADADNDDQVSNIGSITVQCASITVVKTVVGPVPGSAWAFAGPAGRFKLAAGGDQQVFGGLLAGSYTIGETTKAEDGYVVSASCTSGESGINSVTVALGPGENITCTFVNSALPNSITVVKNVVGPPPAGSWEFMGPIGSFTVPAAGGLHVLGDLSVGDHTISETTKDGYTVSVNCTSGESGNNSVLVNLSADESVICTFANTAQAGSITPTPTAGAEDQLPVPTPTPAVLGIEELPSTGGPAGASSDGRNARATGLGLAALLGGSLWLWALCWRRRSGSKP